MQDRRLLQGLFERIFEPLLPEQQSFVLLGNWFVVWSLWTMIQRLEVSELISVLQNSRVLFKFGSLTCRSSSANQIISLTLVEFCWSCILGPLIWKLIIFCLTPLISLCVARSIIEDEWTVLTRQTQSVLNLVKFDLMTCLVWKRNPASLAQRSLSSSTSSVWNLTRSRLLSFVTIISTSVLWEQILSQMQPFLVFGCVSSILMTTLSETGNS